jgi:hypothetical protein
MEISIDSEVLFQLMHSHSRLAQAEYERNPAYSDSHYSAVAEHAMVNAIGLDVVTGYFDYVTAKESSK